jgi:hypothetical protein
MITCPRVLLAVCLCLFIGHSCEHKGYRCLDLFTNLLLVSRHVAFEELSFPFASSGTSLDDLDSLFTSSPTVPPIAPPYPSSIVGKSETVVVLRAALVSPPMPRAVSTPLPATRGPGVLVRATCDLSFMLCPTPLMYHR